jgi:tetratricopeptide (TPR) repeat protein
MTRRSKAAAPPTCRKVFSRRVRAVVAVCALFIVGAMNTSIRATDEVAAYLERLQLRRLLATHLEQELAKRTGDEAEELVVQLAALYTELLETVNDEAMRIELETRGRKLLDRAPPSRADALRLALLRGTYRAVETIAEDHRLRLATEEERRRAVSLLSELMPELGPLRRRLWESAENLDRRMGRASGREVMVMAEEVDRLRGLSTQATFLYAWTLYYHAWLTESDDSAREAIDLFGTILAADITSPQPDDISVDLRASDAFARAILGMALSQSRAAGASPADAWMRLLEVPATVPALRDQAPAWRTVVFMENNDFRTALRILEEYLAQGMDPSIAWLRLLAVHGLEARKDTTANALAQTAVAYLASRGELAMVLDLSRRYGVEALGDAGFAVQYVRGVLLYNEVRDEHGDDLPTVNAKLVAQYGEAASFFSAALREADATKFPQAVAACRSLEAWCRYFQGQFRVARQLFEAASDAQATGDAAESLWMAIVCLDKLVREGGNPELSAELVALIDSYLGRFPSSEFAPRLVLRKTATMDQPTMADVESLLAIPENSTVYVEARTRAAQILFMLFRAAPPDSRDDIGTEFLSVVQGLMLIAEHDVLTGDVEARDRYIRWCRQVLDVAMTSDMQRLGAARTVLETLDVFASEGHLDLAEHHEEFEYRRVQEHLLSETPANADAIAVAMWDREPGGPWAILAARALFNDGYRRWKASRDQDRHDEIAAAYILRHGSHALSEYADEADALEQPSVMGWHAALADVMMSSFARTKDETTARQALELYERMLAVQTNNATFLRATAILTEALGEPERALAEWRRLLAGLPAGTDRWFEARFRSLQILATIDPAHAREVMAQHRQLHPDYGPNPWGARLRTLDQRLDETQQADDASTGDGTS